MQAKYLLIVLAFCISGCYSDKVEQKGGSARVETRTTSAGTKQDAEAPDNTQTQQFWEKLVMVELKDASGMVAAIMPFPSSWQVGNTGGASITGPNGLRVTDYPARNFMNNYNASLNQAYASGGQQMRGMPGVEQLVQEDFVPWGNSQGMQLAGIYEIPEVSKMDKWYSDQLYKAMPSRSEVVAFGIDWKKSDGSPFFMIVHLNVSTSNDMQYWYYMASALEADPAYFETAKKQYIFALANTRYNLEPIMAYNQQEAQRVGQSWAAHNQRMAQNQANFEASQRAHVNKSEAINDAIMSGWRQRNAASDRNQADFVDNIYERTNVQNVETGQQYKVSAGANQYWMNSNGEYISTPLNDYNPNADENMNQVKWQELRAVRNN